MEIPFNTATSTLYALILTLHIVTATEDGVLLKDTEYQKITSNTLKWITPSQPGSIPSDAVIGSVEYVPYNDNEEVKITDRSQLRESKIYICRAFLQGIWVPGAVFEHNKLCVVATMSKAQEVGQYDILINIDQAARLVWQDWERQVEVPRGAVSAGEYFIAHTTSPKLKILSETVAVGMVSRIGKIDPSEGIFGKMSVLDENKELIYDVPSGQVLVEIQPILYELAVTNLQRSREKILSHRALKLGETTLRNNENSEMKAESVISYQWKYESNWGQGRAMSKALETRIQFRNSTPIETINWGMPYVEDRECIENVERILPAGTASHVQINAILSEKEVPYTGTLLSVFLDSNTMNRTIHGIWKFIDLTNITITYGPLYFIQNNSLVPTTTPTEALSPITSTIASTTESMTTETNQLGTKDDHINLITNSDDNDPMQLMKKDNNNNNDSLRISSSWFSILGSVALFISFFF